MTDYTYEDFGLGDYGDGEMEDFDGMPGFHVETTLDELEAFDARRAERDAELAAA